MRRRRFAVTTLAVLLFASVTAGATQSRVQGDPTPPVVTYALVGTEGANGWFTTDVAVRWWFSDPESGIDPLSIIGCIWTTLTQDTVGSDHSCSVANNDGVRTTVTVRVRLDRTPPEVTAANADRPPNANGWYNQPVGFSFAGTDATSGLSSCSSATYRAGDSATAQVAGTCQDRAGNTSPPRAFTLKYDATAPRVSQAVPERRPDKNGWYTSPVAIAFQGSDAVSQVEACTRANYDGPDDEQVLVSGSCRDRAGNESGPTTFSLKYDANPPVLRPVEVDERFNSVVLRWRASTDAVRFVVERSARSGRRSSRGARSTVVYQGAAKQHVDRTAKRGVTYSYAVNAYDLAGNRARVVVAARLLPWLYSPADGARVQRPPLLRWGAVRGATYYNVQLYRGGRKILSMWPTRPWLRLYRKWTYNGQTYRLRPGRYTWFIWPSLGRPVAANFGDLLGRSTFVVVR